MSAENDGYIEDDWPSMPDGSKFDGLNLLALVESGNSPFQHDWNVKQLIEKVEQELNTKVVDVPMECNGFNNYVSIFCCGPKRENTMFDTDQYDKGST